MKDMLTCSRTLNAVMDRPFFIQDDDISVQVCVSTLAFVSVGVTPASMIQHH